MPTELITSHAATAAALGKPTGSSKRREAPPPRLTRQSNNGKSERPMTIKHREAMIISAMQIAAPHNNQHPLPAHPNTPRRTALGTTSKATQQRKQSPHPHHTTPPLHFPPSYFSLSSHSPLPEILPLLLQFKLQFAANLGTPPLPALSAPKGTTSFRTATTF